MHKHCWSTMASGCSRYLICNQGKNCRMIKYYSSAAVLSKPSNYNKGSTHRDLFKPYSVKEDNTCEGNTYWTPHTCIENDLCSVIYAKCSAEKDGTPEENKQIESKSQLYNINFVGDKAKRVFEVLDRGFIPIKPDNVVKFDLPFWARFKHVYIQIYVDGKEDLDCIRHETKANRRVYVYEKK